MVGRQRRQRRDATSELRPGDRVKLSPLGELRNPRAMVGHGQKITFGEMRAAGCDRRTSFRAHDRSHLFSLIPFLLQLEPWSPPHPHQVATGRIAVGITPLPGTPEGGCGGTDGGRHGPICIVFTLELSGRDRYIRMELANPTVRTRSNEVRYAASTIRLPHL